MNHDTSRNIQALMTAGCFTRRRFNRTTPAAANCTSAAVMKRLLLPLLVAVSGAMSRNAPKTAGAKA